MKRAAVDAACVVLGAWCLLALARGGVLWTPACLLSAALLARERLWSPQWRWTPGRVFLAALACYLSTFRWKGGDDIPATLLPLAILKHGTLALNPVLDPWLTGKAHDFTVVYGPHVLSVYPIVAGILAVPLYVLPVLAKADFSLQFLHNLSKVGGALITAGSAALFFSDVRRRCSESFAARLTAVYALGTWAFSVSSQGLWQHGPAQLGVALGLWGLSGEGAAADAACGFGFAFAAAARPDSFFLGAGAALFLLARRPRRALWAAVGAAVPSVLLAAYWLYYTGRLRPPEMGFQSGIFTGFQPQAMAALLLSPTRGLAWFCPAALFGVWAGLRRGQASAARPEPWLLGAAAATWVFLSFYGNWFGGMTFGCRYWAGVSLVLLAFCARLEGAFAARPGLSRAFWACGAASIVTHALGAYLNWPGRFDYPFELAHIWTWGLHPWPALLSAEGSLGALPMAARVAAFLLVGAAGAALAGYLSSSAEAMRYPAKESA